MAENYQDLFRHEGHDRDDQQRRPVRGLSYSGGSFGGASPVEVVRAVPIKFDAEFKYVLTAALSLQADRLLTGFAAILERNSPSILKSVASGAGTNIATAVGTRLVDIASYRAMGAMGVGGDPSDPNGGGGLMGAAGGWVGGMIRKPFGWLFGGGRKPTQPTQPAQPTESQPAGQDVQDDTFKMEPLKPAAPKTTPQPAPPKPLPEPLEIAPPVSSDVEDMIVRSPGHRLAKEAGGNAFRGRGGRSWKDDLSPGLDPDVVFRPSNSPFAESAGGSLRDFTGGPSRRRSSRRAAGNSITNGDGPDPVVWETNPEFIGPPRHPVNELGVNRTPPTWTRLSRDLTDSVNGGPPAGPATNPRASAPPPRPPTNPANPTNPGGGPSGDVFKGIGDKFFEGMNKLGDVFKGVGDKIGGKVGEIVGWVGRAAGTVGNAISSVGSMAGGAVAQYAPSVLGAVGATGVGVGAGLIGAAGLTGGLALAGYATYKLAQNSLDAAKRAGQFLAGDVDEYGRLSGGAPAFAARGIGMLSGGLLGDEASHVGGAWSRNANKVLGKATDPLGTAWSAITNPFGELQDILDSLKDVVGSVKDAFVSLVQKGINPASTLFQMTSQFQQQVGAYNPGATDRYNLSLQNLSAAAGRMFEPVIESAREFADDLNRLYTRIAEPVRGFVSEVVDTVRAFNTEFAVGFVEVVRAAATELLPVVQALKPLAATLGVLARDSLVTFARWVSYLGDVVGPPLVSIIESTTSSLRTFAAVLMTVADDMRSYFRFLKGGGFFGQAASAVPGSQAAWSTAGGLLGQGAGTVGSLWENGPANQYMNFLTNTWWPMLGQGAQAAGIGTTFQENLNSLSNQSSVKGPMTFAAQHARQIGIEEIGMQARQSAFSQGVSIDQQQLDAQLQMVNILTGIQNVMQNSGLGGLLNAVNQSVQQGAQQFKQWGPNP